MILHKVHQTFNHQLYTDRIIIDIKQLVIDSSDSQTANIIKRKVEKHHNLNQKR